MYSRGIINIVIIIVGLVFALILIGYFTTPHETINTQLPPCDTTSVNCGIISH